MAQVAVAWCLTKEGVTAPIVGTTKLQNLQDLIGVWSQNLLFWQDSTWWFQMPWTSNWQKKRSNILKMLTSQDGWLAMFKENSFVEIVHATWYEASNFYIYVTVNMLYVIRKSASKNTTTIRCPNVVKARHISLNVRLLTFKVHWAWYEVFPNDRHIGGKQVDE